MAMPALQEEGGEVTRIMAQAGKKKNYTNFNKTISTHYKKGGGGLFPPVCDQGGRTKILTVSFEKDLVPTLLYYQ